MTSLKEKLNALSNHMERIDYHSQALRNQGLTLDGNLHTSFLQSDRPLKVGVTKGRLWIESNEDIDANFYQALRQASSFVGPLSHLEVKSSGGHDLSSYLEMEAIKRMPLSGAKDSFEAKGATYQIEFFDNILIFRYPAGQDGLAFWKDEAQLIALDQLRIQKNPQSVSVSPIQFRTYGQFSEYSQGVASRKGSPHSHVVLENTLIMTSEELQRPQQVYRKVPYMVQLSSNTKRYDIEMSMHAVDAHAGQTSISQLKITAPANNWDMQKFSFFFEVLGIK